MAHSSTEQPRGSSFRPMHCDSPMIPYTSGTFIGWQCRQCGSLKQDQLSRAHEAAIAFDDDSLDSKVAYYGTIITILIITLGLLAAFVYRMFI